MHTSTPTVSELCPESRCSTSITLLIARVYQATKLSPSAAASQECYEEGRAAIYHCASQLDRAPSSWVHALSSSAQLIGAGILESILKSLSIALVLSLIYQSSRRVRVNESHQDIADARAHERTELYYVRGCDSHTSCTTSMPHLRVILAFGEAPIRLLNRLSGRGKAATHILRRAVATRRGLDATSRPSCLTNFSEHASRKIGKACKMR